MCCCKAAGYALLTRPCLLVIDPETALRQTFALHNAILPVLAAQIGDAF
jgi:hypothetical protein